MKRVIRFECRQSRYTVTVEREMDGHDDDNRIDRLIELIKIAWFRMMEDNR